MLKLFTHGTFGSFSTYFHTSMKSRWLVIFFLLNTVFFCLDEGNAQPVTGVWQGVLVKGKGALQKRSPLEVKLVAQGDSILGTVYYFANAKQYVRYALKGYFGKAYNTIYWQDIAMVENTMPESKLLNWYREGLTAAADFSCPDGRQPLLDGKAELPGDDPLVLKLAKGETALFDDEWNSIIEGFFSGANHKETIDSLWMASIQPKNPGAKGSLASSKKEAGSVATVGEKPKDDLPIVGKTGEKSSSAEISYNSSGVKDPGFETNKEEIGKLKVADNDSSIYTKTKGGTTSAKSAEGDIAKATNEQRIGQRDNTKPSVTPLKTETGKENARPLVEPSPQSSPANTNARQNPRPIPANPDARVASRKTAANPVETPEKKATAPANTSTAKSKPGSQSQEEANRKAVPADTLKSVVESHPKRDNTEKIVASAQDSIAVSTAKAVVPSENAGAPGPAEPTVTAATDRIKEAFSTRRQEVQTEMEVSGDSLELRFYDNAEVDGDSIALFLNGRMLFQHVRLEAKPYIYKIGIQDLTDISELTMVAENLGSIPPNTAFMEAFANGQRFTARLVSTENSSGVIKIVRRR